MKHVKNHVDNEIPTVSKESDDRLGKRVEDGFAWTQARPGACIIKLITAVIYSFHSKLECLSINTNKAGKACQVQTLQLIAVTVNYDRNKFYDTGPRGQCYKTFFRPEVTNFHDMLVFVPSNPFQPGLLFVGMARILP